MSKAEEKGVVSEDALLPAGASAEAQGKTLEPATPGPGSENARDAVNHEETIAALGQEIASLKDQILRRAADYENSRKRIAREREEAVTYANQMLLLDLVPVIDDFERAAVSAESSRDFDALHDGILLIERQLTALLEKKWGLVRFASVGEAFDPHRHHAIAMEETADVQTATVVEEYQKGYLFRDRVLRPATVKVAQPLAREMSEQDNAQGKET